MLLKGQAWYAFSLHTWEANEGRSLLSSRPGWSTTRPYLSQSVSQSNNQSIILIYTERPYLSRSNLKQTTLKVKIFLQMWSFVGEQRDKCMGLHTYSPFSGEGFNYLHIFARQAPTVWKTMLKIWPCGKELPMRMTFCVWLSAPKRNTHTRGGRGF